MPTDRHESFFSSNSWGYLAVSLAIGILTCIGTWLMPVIAQIFFTSPLPTTTSGASAQDLSMQMVVDIGWVITVVIGSVSLWVIAVTCIRIAGCAFEMPHWKNALPQRQSLKFLLVVTFIYLFVSVMKRIDSFSPLSTAIVVVGFQAAGMISFSCLLLSGLYIKKSGWDSFIKNSANKNTWESTVKRSVRTKSLQEILISFGGDPTKAREWLDTYHSQRSLELLLQMLTLGALVGGLFALNII